MLLLEALNSALQALIEQEMQNKLEQEIYIQFAPPNKEFQSKVAKPTVNIFLYDIRENLELRSHKSVTVRDYTRTEFAPLQMSPIHVSFSYILTAWAPSESTTVMDTTIDKILSLLLNILLFYPELPEKYLDESIKAIRPLPKMQILHPTYLQSVGEFWHALEGQPKPFIHCTITTPIYPDLSYGQLVTNVMSDITFKAESL